MLKNLYIYWKETIPSNIIKILKDLKIGVWINDEYFLSKEEKIIFLEVKIEYYLTFGEWLSSVFNENREKIIIIESQLIEISIFESEVMQMFIEKLYKGKESYADKIYNAKEPYQKIQNIINEMVAEVISLKLEKIKKELNKVKNSLEDDSFSWDE